MRMGLPGAGVRGAAAAAVGTLGMDLLWYARYRRGGGHDGFLDWERSAGTTGFEGAGAPAQVGRRVVHALLRVRLPDRSAATTNTAVHWATGAQWGALYGVASRSSGGGPLRGAALGSLAWATSYVVLPLAGIYQPIWKYDAKTLADDYSAHLLFGIVTATTFGAMGHRRR